MRKTLLKTGSLVLNRLIGRYRVHSGLVLHLYGGNQSLRTGALLEFCRATIQGGGSSVFIDLGGAFSPALIQNAGLASYYNAGYPGDPNARFRVLSPPTPVDFDKALVALAGQSSPPAVVVVHGLPELLYRYYRGANHQKAEKVLDNLVRKANILVGQGGFALWFAHSAPPLICGAGGIAMSVRPSKWKVAVWNTLDRHCRYGLQLGTVIRRRHTTSYFFVEVSVWRLGTLMRSTRTLGMWNNGRFKNP